jgi:hypothetical protein
MEGFSVHWEFLIEPWALLKDLPAGSEVLTIAMVESCCNHQLHLPQKKNAFRKSKNPRNMAQAFQLFPRTSRNLVTSITPNFLLVLNVGNGGCWDDYY